MAARKNRRIHGSADISVKDLEAAGRSALRTFNKRSHVRKRKEAVGSIEYARRHPEKKVDRLARTQAALGSSGLGSFLHKVAEKAAPTAKIVAAKISKTRRAVKRGVLSKRQERARIRAAGVKAIAEHKKDLEERKKRTRVAAKK